MKDSNNNPIEGVTVASTSQPSGQSILEGVTDSNGSVTFSDINVGSYHLIASKSGFSDNTAQTEVESREMTSLVIILQSNPNELNISVTLSPNDSGTAQRIFTVTIDDENFKNGISNVTLYIDESPVETWTNGGVHTYEGIYLIGTHEYYVEAMKGNGENIRSPTSVNWEFNVTEEALESVELWKILAIVLILANGGILTYLSLKRKS